MAAPRLAWLGLPSRRPVSPNGMAASWGIRLWLSTMTRVWSRMSGRHSGLAKGPRRISFVLESLAKNGLSVCSPLGVLAQAPFHVNPVISASKPRVRMPSGGGEGNLSNGAKPPARWRAKSDRDGDDRPRVGGESPQTDVAGA